MYGTYINNDDFLLKSKISPTAKKNSIQGAIIGLGCTLTKIYIQKNILFNIISVGDVAGITLGIPISKKIVDKLNFN